MSTINKQYNYLHKTNEFDNEKLREKLEKKYNINLDVTNKEGEITYWEFREYFTKEIQQNNLLISTNWIVYNNGKYQMDIETIKENFNEQLKEIIDDEKTIKRSYNY